MAPAVPGMPYHGTRAYDFDVVCLFAYVLTSFRLLYAMSLHKARLHSGSHRSASRARRAMETQGFQLPQPGQLESSYSSCVYFLLLVTRQIKRCSLAFAMVPIFTTPVSMATSDHYNDVSLTLVVIRKLRAPSPILDDAAASKGHGAGGLYHVPFRALHALVRLEPRDSGDKGVQEFLGV